MSSPKIYSDADLEFAFAISELQNTYSVIPTNKERTPTPTSPALRGYGYGCTPLLSRLQRRLQRERATVRATAEVLKTAAAAEWRDAFGPHSRRTATVTARAVPSAVAEAATPAAAHQPSTRMNAWGAAFISAPLAATNVVAQSSYTVVNNVLGPFIDATADWYIAAEGVVATTAGWAASPQPTTHTTGLSYEAAAELRQMHGVLSCLPLFPLKKHSSSSSSTSSSSSSSSSSSIGNGDSTCASKLSTVVSRSNRQHVFSVASSVSAFSSSSSSDEDDDSEVHFPSCSSHEKLSAALRNNNNTNNNISDNNNKSIASSSSPLFDRLQSLLHLTIPVHVSPSSVSKVMAMVPTPFAIRRWAQKAKRALVEADTPAIVALLSGLVAVAADVAMITVETVLTRIGMAGVARLVVAAMAFAFAAAATVFEYAYMFYLSSSLCTSQKYELIPLRSGVAEEMAAWAEVQDIQSCH